jgi:hypothetical protein
MTITNARVVFTTRGPAFGEELGDFELAVLNAALISQDARAEPLLQRTGLFAGFTHRLELDNGWVYLARIEEDEE